MARKGGLYVYQQIAKTRAEWLEENPVVPDRVLVYETDTEMFKMGNGKTRYKDLKGVFEHGKEPRINIETGHWEIWSRETGDWYDTGQVSVLAYNIDGGGPDSVYTEDQHFNFGGVI